MRLVLGEVPPVTVAVVLVAHILSHLVGLADTRDHGVAQSRGSGLRGGPSGPDGGGSCWSKAS